MKSLFKTLPLLAILLAPPAQADGLKASDFLGTYEPLATISGSCPTKSLTIETVKLGGDCGKEAQLEIRSDNGALYEQITSLNCGAYRFTLYNDGLYMATMVKQIIGYSEGAQTLDGNQLLKTGARKIYPTLFNLPNYLAQPNIQANVRYELTLDGDILQAKVEEFDRQSPVLDRSSDCLLKKVR